jgi:UDP-glucose:(heptosyl)LPS alpha-1,3-glucosyltransferase
VYEPFPNVNLEAMACGTPVITTKTAGGADIIVEGTNGYLIPDAWAVDALVERIDHHLSLSSAEKQSMSEGCWQTASQLRLADNAQKVAEVFEDVVREKNAA